MYSILKDISKSQRFDFRVFLDPNSAKSRKILKQAREYDSKLFYFTDNENCYFKFDQLNQTYKYFISFNPMFCSCSWYLDHKNSRHLLAACIIAKTEPDEERSFVVIKSRDRPKGTKEALKKD